jgi:lysophospholipase L1-like esterase
MSHQTKTRRTFIKNITAASALVIGAPQMMYAGEKTENNEGENFTFLFQGDSITDGNRTRDNDWNHVMGHGYQYIIASKLWYDLPQKRFHFYNRGVSGNKVTDLAARWQTDTIDLKPDLLSILIGINDTSAYINGDNNFSADAYEQEYRTLLQQTKQQLPNVELVLCEPFILPVGKVKDRYEVYSTEIKKRQPVVQKLAAEFNAVYVSFQDAFNKALSEAPAEYWIWDGVHPMPAGHELMAIEWARAVSKRIKFIK